MGKLAVAVIVSIWVIPISILVNRIVPEPYMDEIFHVPQAQQYCKGNFRSWDPMITTPPGLYCLSLAYAASLFPGMSFLKAASSFSDVCFTSILRSTNGVLAVLCSTIIYEILIKLRPHLDTRKATVYTLVLTLYPLHWFFTFLYYTDIASLTAILAAYLECLKKNYHSSALLGAFAVFIRQTNIIWVLFVACTGVIDFTLSSQTYKVRSDEVETTISNTGEITPDNSATVGPGVRKRKVSKAGSTVKNTIPKSGSSTLKAGLLEELKVIIIRSWHMKWELLVSFFPFFLVLLGFATFICWNGSVVLGAKEAHTVSPHFAQIMYFSLFSFLATAPLHFAFSQNVKLLRSIWKKRPASCFHAFLLLTAAFLAVHFYSLAHPYLLADNRHYPFYLWRKIIKAHWTMKYLLVPLYTYAWLSIFYRLGKFQKKSWIMIYFVSTAAVLIPAPLIEFRYFTIPFYFLALHIHVDDVRRWLLMGLSYVAVNALTLVIFLLKPFHWPHEPGTQRFIW